ncbi:hypothetical protein D1007_23511 [Hordeum vulgare]|nr:hypothetical protein D1007_23511 [Hordeum vulgare]
MDEVTRFLKHDPTVPTAEQQQQAPAVHVDVQSAMQLELQQAPPMVSVQHPQPEAPPMPLRDQQMLVESPATMFLHPGDHMVNELMPAVQQRLGESTVTVPPTLVDQDQHMVGESPSAMPPPHQQMLGDTPVTMPRHPHYHMICELLPVLEQRLGESPAAMPQPDGHGQHVMGAPARTLLQHQTMMVDHPPVAYGFTDLDEDLGIYGLFLENEYHMPGGNGVTGMPEPPAVPSAVVPLAPAPEQASCQDCQVVQLVRSHNAAMGKVTTLSLHRASDGTYMHTVLETTGTGDQGPNYGSQLIHESLRDSAPEEVPKIVESCIRMMRDIVGPVEDVITVDGKADAEAEASSSMVGAPPTDTAGPSRAPDQRDTLQGTFSVTISTLREINICTCVSDTILCFLYASMHAAAPVAPPPPPTHRRWPQQPERVLSPAEQEDEETRQYLRRARERAEKEMSSLPLALKRFCRDVKNPDNRNPMLHRIKKLNKKIKDTEKEAWRVGNELTKIRRLVDDFVTEKTRLYATLTELMEKEGKICRSFPPHGDDDEAGGNGGAAGAAVS